MKPELESPFNRICISYNRRGHNAFAVFLLSFFIGICRRAVSAVGVMYAGQSQKQAMPAKKVFINAANVKAALTKGLHQREQLQNANGRTQQGSFCGKDISKVSKKGFGADSL